MGIVLGGGALVAIAALVLVFGSSAIRPQNATPTASIQPDECAPAALANNPSACLPRESYLNAARTLRTQLYPQLAAISLSSWSPKSLSEVQELEQTALEQFDIAEYVQAADKISQAVDLARHHLNRAQAVLRTALDEMIVSFDENNTAQAQSSLNQARWIDANHPQILEYAPRIEILDQTIALQQKAAIAKIENRPANELQALEALVALDSARREHLPRIAELKNLRRRQAYSLAIAQAEQSLGVGQLAKARQFVAQANKLEPSEDHRFLLGRIETAERIRRVRVLLRQASEATDNDDFSTARARFEQVLAINPTHKEATSGGLEAQAIVTAKGKLTGYLAQPLRLASPRVAEFARRDLITSQALLAKSAQLRILDNSVREYLALAQVPVSVAVVSDGATDISVRRVGQVGKHKRKTIQLTPGLYEFEGRRSGYKSALVELEIPYGVASMEIRVEANERI